MKNIVKQKLAYAWHGMRGFSGLNALLFLDRKFDGKIRRGRPRRSRTDDVIQWTQKKKYDEVKRLAEDRDTWRKMTQNLLTQKMAHE